MKLNEALQHVIIAVKTYIDKVTPTKLSDLEIDMEIGGSFSGSWNDITDKPFEDDGTISEKCIPDTIQRTSEVLSQANQSSLDDSYSPTAASDLVTKEYVDSISIAPSEIEALSVLAETGFINQPIVGDNCIFTDSSGAIFTL